ncbi:MAG: hypothetical protein AMS25_15685 [Gemmatimonas sp. SM23_52]|nr:MAG: hypothetical protein AMS25_15685 [Gemmatimonas sp. SM23_52]
MERSPIHIEDVPPIGGALPAPEDTPIVVVDDEPSVLSFLRKVLEAEGYPVETFESAQEAFTRISQAGVALLIADIVLPDMGGMELVRRSLEEDPSLSVLILTGAADTESAVESLRLGVDDYLQKPISADDLIVSVARALRHRAQADYRDKLETWLRSEVTRRTEEVQRRSQELELVTVATLSTLVRAMEAKDPYLKGHSERIASLCGRMARHLGFDARDIEDVRTAGLLHDIGMIAVPESILHTEGELSEEEYRQVKEHVEIAANILEPLSHIARAVSYIRCHHERLDGSGYPRGLRGSDIPLAAQIVGLAEYYGSLTERRPHRRAYSAVEALETVRASRDVWFEARVMDALEQVVSSEPELVEPEPELPGPD